MNYATKTYPKVKYKKTIHAVNADGNTGPEDGSLFGFYTLCGLLVKDDQKNPEWQETINHSVTCKHCIRKAQVIAASKHPRPKDDAPDHPLPIGIVVHSGDSTGYIGEVIKHHATHPTAVLVRWDKYRGESFENWENWNGQLKPLTHRVFGKS
jgi:hypothetical protein